MLVPVPADFDLSSFVTGTVSRSDNGELKGSFNEQLAESMKDSIAEYTKRADSNKKSALIHDILTREETLLKTILEAHIDEKGGEIAMAHIETFFAELQK